MSPEIYKNLELEIININLMVKYIQKLIVDLLIKLNIFILYQLRHFEVLDIFKFLNLIVSSISEWILSRKSIRKLII